MVMEIRFFFSPPPAAMAARGPLISLNSPEVNSGEFKVPACQPERLARHTPRPACGGACQGRVSPLASSW